MADAMLIIILFIGLGFYSSHSQQEHSANLICYLVLKPKNGMLSTYSEDCLENTRWPCDSAAYQGTKAWCSRGSLYQGHDTEALA